MRKTLVVCGCVALLLASAITAVAQSASVDSFKLPVSFLAKADPKSVHAGDKLAAFGTKKAHAGTGPSAFATTGIPGVDSLTSWSDQFVAAGFDGAGNPQSVWPYTMVGTPPESGRTTIFKAPIVPVSVDLLLPNGQVAVFNGHPLTFDPGAYVGKVLNSPVFQPWLYSSGLGQFNDQMLRAEFWDRFHTPGGHDNGWHNVLAPVVRRSRRIQVPYGSWYFFVDANNNPIAAAIDGNVFVNLFFPTTVPVDNSTPIGAAELAGDITTRDISTFLFNNVYLFDGSINNCCVLGFHSYDFEPGDARNGNRERRYVLNYSSWLADGLFAFGFEDVTALSHEMSELYNDPFVDNATPWWLNIDPFFGYGICQNNLETGDVVEVLTSNAVFPITTAGRTYHPQNEVLFSWFAFQSPSQAHLGAYSFPDETTQTTLSPGNLLPGCVPAP